MVRVRVFTDLTCVHNTVESGVICTIVPTGGVKTGELVHTSQSQDGVCMVKIEGKYEKTTTPECSEDRVLLPTPLTLFVALSRIRETKFDTTCTSGPCTSFHNYTIKQCGVCLH